jgi:hypothetical protein
MNSTDENRPNQLAGALFDEVISPVGNTRATAGEQAYFPTGKDMKATTYYSEPLARVMQPADFEFPGGGTVEGLVDALAAHWLAQGETELAAMAPRLKEIAEAWSNEAAAGDDSVSIFCYTMF